MNIAMANRMWGDTETDSLLNAIVLLDLCAKAVPWELSQSLAQIRPLFAPYLEVPPEQ